jgi:hypothetical protein
MAKDGPKPLRNSELVKNLDDFAALMDIPDYKSTNPDYEKPALQASKDAMQAKETLAAQKKAEYDAARDDEINAQRDFHNRMKGSRMATKTQFGPNSNQAQAVGLKKEVEYKSRARKNGDGTPPTT